jgi:Putative MetA-pathway of phenol degradation
MRPGAVATLLLLAAAPAFGQTRPLQTEEATTAPGGHVTFETGAEAIRDEPSYITGKERTRWDGPLLRLVYSPSDRVELDVEWVALVGAAGEEGREDVSDWGDVSLRAKLRLLGGKGGKPTLGARFGVTLPETSFNDVSFRPLGLGPNTVRAFVQALFTQPLGGARLHANAGLLTFDEVFRSHEQRDFLLYGLALTVPFGKSLEALAEVAGRAGEGTPGAEQRSEVRAGFRFGRGRVRGDAAVRRGLAPADGTWGATMGLAWILRTSSGASASSGATP